MTDEKNEVRISDLGPREGMKPPTFLRYAGKVYRVPDGVLRLAVAKLIELASCGDLDQIDQDKTVELRATDAIAFMARTLRCTTEEECDLVIAEEVERFGGDARGAQEVYGNLMSLEQWLGLFYGSLSKRFLCPDHAPVAEIQQAIAESYLEESAPDDEDAPPQDDHALAAALTDSVRRVNAQKLFGTPDKPSGGH